MTIIPVRTPGAQPALLVDDFLRVSDLRYEFLDRSLSVGNLSFRLDARFIPEVSSITPCSFSSQDFLALLERPSERDPLLDQRQANYYR